MISFKNMTREDMPLFMRWADKTHVKETWFVDGYETTDKYHEKINGNGYDHGYIIYCEFPIIA